MRLLHLDSGASMRGGQWQALRLVEGLSQAGHQVTLLARNGSPLLKLACKSGIDAHPLSAFTVRRLSRQVDLTHAHDAYAHTIAALMSAAPFVVSRRVGFPVQGGVSRWKYGRARRFIAVSNYVKSVLIASGIGADRITVVYDGVPLLPSAIQVQRIVAPASDDPKKGTAVALEAARLTGASLIVSTDLERDLPGASLFVYISHSEGLGSGILLAMSAGVPVIASNTGGIPEIVEDGISGLLVRNRAEEVAAAMLRLQEDPPFAERLAGRARQEVEERFSIAAMLAGTIRTYERALGC